MAGGVIKELVVPGRKSVFDHGRSIISCCTIQWDGAIGNIEVKPPSPKTPEADRVVFCSKGLVTLDIQRQPKNDQVDDIEIETFVYEKDCFDSL